MTERIRILIADDHPVVRTGLQGMLASQPDFELLGEAADGAEALRLTEALKPDVVLMDLRMPGLDGAEATRQIRAGRPGVHVIILTTYDGDADILRAVEAGAIGYLLKDAPRDELYRAIRAAARGETTLAAGLASRLMRGVRAPAGPAALLSTREIEVLAQVAKGASNKEIARALHISEATVKSHLLHIFGKLGIADRTAAVTLALERGWLKLGGPENDSTASTSS